MCNFIGLCNEFDKIYRWPMIKVCIFGAMSCVRFAHKFYGQAEQQVEHVHETTVEADGALHTHDSQLIYVWKISLWQECTGARIEVFSLLRQVSPFFLLSCSAKFMFSMWSYNYYATLHWTEYLNRKREKETHTNAQKQRQKKKSTNISKHSALDITTHLCDLYAVYSINNKFCLCEYVSVCVCFTIEKLVRSKVTKESPWKKYEKSQWKHS